MAAISCSRRITGFVLVMGIISHCQSAVVQFAIDPGETRVTLSGTAAGLSVDEQSPGSLTTSFQGTVVAELTGESIQFLGGSLIEGVTNGTWSPKAFGAAGTEPAEFGAQASGGFISGTAALRDLLLDLESESALTLTEGKFNVDGLLFRFPEDAPSAFDYRVTAFIITTSDRRLLAGYATNRISATGSLTSQGRTQTLQLPIEATTMFELLDPADSTLTITGQLRATRELPVSGIVIGPVRFLEGNLAFEWSGGTVEAVRIESSGDLVNWSHLVDLPAGVTSWSVEPGAGVRFFRVVQ